MSSELEVFVSDYPVGLLSEDIETGLIDFRYLPDVPDQMAVSLLMPPSAPAEEYLGYNGVPPPFQVSLPEGIVLEAIRTRFAKHIDVDNDMSLLRLVGRHTIGRTTFGGPLDLDATLQQNILDAARTEGAAQRLIEILKTSPEMFGVSGVMPKMSTFQTEKTRPGTVAAHGSIVKFDSPHYVGASLVEYACLKACSAAGLDVPAIELSPDRTSLTMSRFDIAPDGSRRGFEDACALSGLFRSGKYNGSIEHLFEMIRFFVHPDDQATDRLAMLKLVMMNDALRNGDAHLKNFGLVYDDVMRPRLSPVYDVLTTQVWFPQEVPALAMQKTDPRGTEKWLDQLDLERLASLSHCHDVDVVQMQAQCREIALQSMATTLDECPKCPPRKALEHALKIIEGALPVPSASAKK
ncbi:type II toxin-antitoxin system HipA family toxin [Cupriavidus pampae]|uniref:Type II toxin-antitoxin system HipA family toxin n=1 Tax=Cupriavidus pampae TaxID=659251 RepID=A0ABN7ZQ42_9BURK|nr:HipA domain-containing protein [Cupriavidus pampae]CAG9186421.1 hypothetical protein LMG32289_06416 [Cupriavidus pampae]